MGELGCHRENGGCLKLLPKISQLSSYCIGLVCLHQFFFSQDTYRYDMIWWYGYRWYSTFPDIQETQKKWHVFSKFPQRYRSDLRGWEVMKIVKRRKMRKTRRRARQWRNSAMESNNKRQDGRTSLKKLQPAENETYGSTQHRRALFCKASKSFARVTTIHVGLYGFCRVLLERWMVSETK